MSDNNVGFFQGPMAPLGSIPNGSVRFANSYSASAQYDSSGITVFPTAYAGANGASPQSTTGSEKAVIPLNVPLEMSNFMNVSEVLFTYPLQQQPRVGRAYNAPPTGIATVSILNLQLRQDWEAIKRLSKSQEDNEVVRFAKEYMEYGEDYFTMNGPNEHFKWANFARVMQDDKYKMFRMASKYGIDMINFIGIKELSKEINANNPLGRDSSQVAGTTNIRNYWGTSAMSGCKVGFVIRKESVEGPYQIVPWSTGSRDNLPNSMLTYEDCAGELHPSRVLTIGRVTYPVVGSYAAGTTNGIIGLTDEIRDITELSTSVAQMGMIQASLFTSSRFFI